MLLLYRNGNNGKISICIFTFHYASTLSVIGIDLGITTLHLHSTMLLLYPWGDRVVFFELRIYIPLCFYFINLGRDYINVVNKFTFHYASTLSLPYAFLILKHRNLHSTMLLLYRIDSHRLGDQFRNLHSTMLLLYHDGTCNRGVGTVIYIPLCFYFIRIDKCVKTDTTDLHSTMLLLYRSGRRQNVHTKQIYIPLCFYFIDTI